MKPLAQCSLYAFVDAAYLHGRSVAAIAQELCDGGADLIQLRAKGASPEEVRRMAESISSITRRARVGLIINDHFPIAEQVGAEFCHLGQEDFFDAGHTHVSQLVSVGASGQMPSSGGPAQLSGGTQAVPAVRVGLSTYSPAQASRALAAGADYIAVGPVYATGTKPGACPVTLAYVRWAAENVKIPWFAIGGITLENLDEVLSAGARRICVVSAILNAPDIAGLCRQFKRRLEKRGVPPLGPHSF